MVEHTQNIRRLLLTSCLSVFDHFWGCVLKGLTTEWFTLYLIVVPTFMCKELKNLLIQNDDVVTLVTFSVLFNFEISFVLD